MQTANYPVAPTTTPLVGTLLDVATVTDNFAWLDGRGLFESYNCMKFGAEPTFCGPNVKDFDQSGGWQDGARFGAYGGVMCSTVGLDRERMVSEVGRVFKAGESTAVERGLLSTRFVADTSGDDLWDAPLDLTPSGGAATPAVGVAILEGYAASNYVGSPTLHLPVSVVSMLTQVNGIERSGRILRTRLGAKIAAGAGYDYPSTGPTGAEATGVEKWGYVTGEVVIGRSEMILRDAIAHEDNQVYVLAERGYIVAVDCFVAAVRMTISA